MNCRKTLFLFALLAAATLSACSGLPVTSTCTTNCITTSGNALLSVTLQAEPLTPPPSTNLLSYSLVVGGITLTPSTGNPTNIPGPFTFDLTRLQSDSAFLGTVQVPAGTYTSLTISLTSAEVTYCTVTAGVPGCTSGTVTQISGGASAPVFTFADGGLVLTASQQAGISVAVNIASTLTIANQAVTGIDLADATLSSVTLGPTHPSSLTSTQLDYLEDVTGNVSVNGNAVTIKTSTYGSLTATASDNTFYSPNCTILGLALSIACVQNNQVASINAILDADGTIDLISFDPISAASATNNDWLEGVVIYPTSGANRLNIVVNDADVSSSASVLPTTIPIGSPVTVLLSNSPAFGVDSQGLNVPGDAASFSFSSLLPGQAVAVHVLSFSTTGGTPTGILVTSDAVELRFSRVAGTAAQSGTTTNFTLATNSLPTYFDFITANQLVEFTSGTPPSTNSTNYDGVSSPGNITSGDTYSIRALYFGQNDTYPFVAAKVRQNPIP
jgi:hypothetical protein